MYAELEIALSRFVKIFHFAHRKFKPLRYTFMRRKDRRRRLCEMTTMELLMIPGLDSSRKLREMRKESQKRMNDAVRSQMLAAAMMSAREESKEQKKQS